MLYLQSDLGFTATAELKYKSKITLKFSETWALGKKTFMQYIQQLRGGGAQATKVNQ